MCYFIPATLKTVNVTRATSIPEDAFYNCDCIEEIIIPSDCSSIGVNAFYSCSMLTRFNSNVDGVCDIPTSIETISNYAFYGCNLFEEITMGDVSSIGDYAFYGCSMVSKFNSETACEALIPNNCVSIGAHALHGMGLITNLVVSDSVETIGAGAFQGFGSLEEITVPFVGYSENSTGFDTRVFGYIFGGVSNGST